MTYGKKRLFGLPITRVESLMFSPIGNSLTPCRIDLSACLPLRFRDSEGSPLGRLKRAWRAAMPPEYQCVDEEGRLIGTITPGSGSAEIRFNRRVCCAQYSEAKSKAQRPRQWVWECMAISAKAIDIRLLLGVIAVREISED
jgi:hypothetical protein